MIVWVNGAFGAGKTSLVRQLTPRLPNAMAFDPELVGFMLMRVVPPSPTDDFQDLPIWRGLVVRTMLELRRHYASDLIVPMTLVNPAYVDEIFGELRANGEDIVHFFLRVRPELLRRRITDQVMVPHDAKRDEEVRQWRSAQVDRCAAAAPLMPADTEFLDSETYSPEELAAQVLKRLES